MMILLVLVLAMIPTAAWGQGQPATCEQQLEALRRIQQETAAYLQICLRDEQTRRMGEALRMQQEQQQQQQQRQAPAAPTPAKP